MERHAFRAMGTDVELLLDAVPGAESKAALEEAEQELRRLEGLLSRFLPGSELSALNRLGSLEAGDELLTVTRLALEARTRTGGLFDPTVHDALVAAGYDRTFEEVGDGPAGAPRPCGGEVRIEGQRIELERGFRLDLGGIAKGWAVDRAAAVLDAAGPCLVNAGGDVATRGGRWPVGVETADGSLTLELGGGGLATSGRDRRRWRRDGVEQHHLIDPRTGAPAKTDLVRVTAVAPDAIEAEVAAKSLFLAGAERAAAEADAAGIASVLVTADGRSLFTGALAA
jgi:thiamine biosynthesis lipoprotein